MTNREVKTLFIDTVNILNYFIKREEKNFKLLYGINKNYEKLEKEEKLIDKTAKQQLPELFEIEEKAARLILADNEIIISENSSLSDDKKKPLLTIADGLKLLSQEEQDKHSELMKEYDKILEQPNDFELYKLKLSDIEDVEAEFSIVRLLAKFI